MSRVYIPPTDVSFMNVDPMNSLLVHCSVCGKGKNLVVCEGCQQAYHLNCRPLLRTKSSTWRCGSCCHSTSQQVPSRLDVQSDARSAGLRQGSSSSAKNQLPSLTKSKEHAPSPASLYDNFHAEFKAGIAELVRERTKGEEAALFDFSLRRDRGLLRVRNASSLPYMEIMMQSEAKLLQMLEESFTPPSDDLIAPRYLKLCAWFPLDAVLIPRHSGRFPNFSTSSMGMSSLLAGGIVAHL